MAKKRRRKKESLRALDVIIYLLLAALLIGTCFAVGLVISAYRDLPDLSNLEPTASATSILYDGNGEVWTELRSGEYRIPISIKEMPDHVLKSVLAAEDHRFYSHMGFDIRAIARAFYQNITDASGLQGGSTITQQLAKIAFLEPERTLKRKVQDVMVATLLERKYTKNEILEMYVTKSPLGAEPMV